MRGMARTRRRRAPQPGRDQGGRSRLSALRRGDARAGARRSPTRWRAATGIGARWWRRGCWTGSASRSAISSASATPSLRCAARLRTSPTAISGLIEIGPRVLDVRGRARRDRAAAAGRAHQLRLSRAAAARRRRQGGGGRGARALSRCRLAHPPVRQRRAQPASLARPADRVHDPGGADRAARRRRRRRQCGRRAISPARPRRSPRSNAWAHRGALVFAIYLAEILALGAVRHRARARRGRAGALRRGAAAAGGAAGDGAARALSRAAGRWPPRSALLTTLAFALWPVGAAAEVRPASLFRSRVEPMLGRPPALVIAAVAAAAILLAALAIAHRAGPRHRRLVGAGRGRSAASSSASPPLALVWASRQAGRPRQREPAPRARQSPPARRGDRGRSSRRWASASRCWWRSRWSRATSPTRST